MYYLVSEVVWPQNSDSVGCALLIRLIGRVSLLMLKAVSFIEFTRERQLPDWSLDSHMVVGGRQMRGKDV